MLIALAAAILILIFQREIYTNDLPTIYRKV